MNQDGSASFRRLSIIFQEMTQLAESRPAGSPGEEKLKQYIEESLRNSGYTLSRQGFRFPQIPRLYNEQFINAIFVIAGILLIQTAPLIGFLLPVIFSVLPVLMLESVKLLPKKNSAENLVAVPKNSSLNDTPLLIVAHMDTARTIPILRGKPGEIIDHCQRSFFNISFIIAIQCFAVLIHIPLPVYITIALNMISIIISLVTICYQIWVSLFRPSIYSPGANDNTSGVATALALAETLSKGKKERDFPVAFLFTSAEEQGLFGATAFTNSRIDWESKPSVINIDSIAGGNKLGLVTRYGRFLPLYTTNALNRILKDVDHNLVDILHIHRCGDYLPFLRSGYKVTSIESVWNSGTPPEYHTVEDIPDRINFELLSKAYSVLNGTINYLNSQQNG